MTFRSVATRNFYTHHHFKYYREDVFYPQKTTSQEKKVNFPNFTDFFTVLRINYALKTQYQRFMSIENKRVLQYKKPWTAMLVQIY